MDWFNRNSGKSGGPGGKKTILTPRLLMLAVILVAAFSIVGTSVFMVDGTEQAVITRFGKLFTTKEAGLHFKLPFGIDKNYNIPTKVVQTEQFGFSTLKTGAQNQYKNGISLESTMLTGDLNIIDVEWIIQYRIVDPAAWLFNVRERTQTIRDISQSVVNMLVGDRAILEVMGAARSTIEASAQELMNENFRQFNLGINVIAVKLQNIVPPRGVQDAFEDVNKATQDMNRFINEGKEAYNAEIPRAQGQADQQVLIAQGYAAERVNMAKGDTARFNAVYEEYRRAPAVTRDRLYLEAMENIFNASEKDTLIDKRIENMLPLKNLSTGAQAK